MAKGNVPKNKGKKKIYNPKTNTIKFVNDSEIDLFIKKGWVKGSRPFTEEHKGKLSVSHKGKSSWNKGISPSNETKSKISDSVKLRYETDPSYRERVGSSHRGKKQTCESNVKRSNALKGRKQTPESNAKRSVSMKGKKHFLTEEAKLIKLQKEYETKKKNKSFNTSKPEEDYYKKLLIENKGKTVLRQYKDERYPYYCDFYIVEDDLFIELNKHWSHGPAPFNTNNKNHLDLLEEWKEKSKQSKFYAQSITTWTIRDVEKQTTAKKNGLNYITIY